ncbi:MAG: transcriptional regulator [Mesorhizobium sp.]|nr:MAG: transcriptional regulator [Mesorhizobium sp.]
MRNQAQRWRRSLAHQVGSSVLDLDRGTLRRDGEIVPVRPKTFDLLAFLVRNPGRVLSKDELFQAVWPNTIVTEDSLTQCIRDVRKCIGDEAQSLVRTVPRRGYMFQASNACPLRCRRPALRFRLNERLSRWSPSYRFALILTVRWQSRSSTARSRRSSTRFPTSRPSRCWRAIRPSRLPNIPTRTSGRLLSVSAPTMLRKAASRALRMVTARTSCCPRQRPVAASGRMHFRSGPAISSSFKGWWRNGSRPRWSPTSRARRCGACPPRPPPTSRPTSISCAAWHCCAAMARASTSRPANIC